MLSELSKLFGRNFAIGFFLPAVILISISALMFNLWVFHADIFRFTQFTLLAMATVLGFLSWIVGIVLMAINHDLYRFMEGYGSYNPLNWFAGFERRRFEETVKEKEALDKQLLECTRSKTAFPIESDTKRNMLMRRLAGEFPHDKRYLLPTPFGNVLRSFETFPYVMYGIDAISTWGRMMAVIPRDYIGLIDAARTQVDFWVNMGMVFILLQIEYVGLVYATGNPLHWWIVVLWIVLGTVAPIRATSSARAWGEYVKSIFDLYRLELLDALHIEQPSSRDEERQLWKRISEAFIYRLPSQLPELKQQKPPRKESWLERVFKKTE